MLEKINTLDTRLFLFLNEKHNTFFDPVMYWASDTFFWIPLYVVVSIILIAHYKKASIYIFISIIILITLSDQAASQLIKNTLVMRLRPSHEPALNGLIHLSEAGPGGAYGFVSSHAANAFSFSTFLCLLLPSRFKWLKYTLFFWAMLVSYSRIYNGVHYPSDVICAAGLGALLACLMFKIYSLFLSYNNTKT